MMTMEPTNLEKVRALPWVVVGFVGNAVFSQYTYFGSAFVLFLSILGFDLSRIGFLLSLIYLLVTLAVFVTPLLGQLGYKRAFLYFLTARILVTMLVLLAPWLLGRLGPQFVLIYLSTVIVVFALLRTVTDTVQIAWQQEFVPRSIQGKLIAANNMSLSLASIIAFVGGSYILNRLPDVKGYLWLFTIGILCGLVADWAYTHIPGGAKRASAANGANLPGVLAALSDRDFQFWLAGITLMVLATAPLVAFLPLFLLDKVGLTSAQIVLLQTGQMVPGLLASYLWGWTADRYGAKPIMLWGVYLIAVLPVLWFIMPRQTSAGFAIAMAITLLQGLAFCVWGVGLNPLFFVSVVPSEGREGYMAAHFAALSLSTGLSTLASGWFLQFVRGAHGQLAGFSVDGYSVLFGLSVVTSLLAAVFFIPIRADSTMTTGQLAGLFLRGNIVTALASPVSFHIAKNEREAVTTTERLGTADSPLTVNELLEGLRDPRFNVRLETIISIARRSPDDQLREALFPVLQGNDPALSALAARALGRVGDTRAIESLRLALGSRYRSVRAQSARALGVLGDGASAGTLLQRLEGEPDLGLQVAYATVLGKLREARALPFLLRLLWEAEEEINQRELALAVVRLLGDDRGCVQLCRQLDKEPGAALHRR